MKGAPCNGIKGDQSLEVSYYRLESLSVKVSTSLICIGDLGLLLQNVAGLNSAQFLREAAKMGVRGAESDSSSMSFRSS
jgi:hypothetical protein